jgi:hypothetical protein
VIMGGRYKGGNFRDLLLVLRHVPRLRGAGAGLQGRGAPAPGDGPWLGSSPPISRWWR